MKVRLEMLESSDLPYILLEGVFVVDGTFLDMCPIVVDGVDAVMQELCYFAAVGVSFWSKSFWSNSIFDEFGFWQKS